MTEHYHHTYTCLCGDPWFDRSHTLTMTRELRVTQWHGNPGQMVPHRQWVRENLPPTHAGFVCAGDDGFARSWVPGDDEIGHVTPLEWKTYGKPLDTPTAKIFHILAAEQHRIREPLTIRLFAGNVPTALRHYPWTDECDLPEQPVVAARVLVNDYDVDPARLAEIIIEHTRPQDEAA